jgi:hypothetical protein
MDAAPALLAALETLWQEVLAAPEDDSKHTKFFAFAVQNDLFLPAIERWPRATGVRGRARRCNKKRTLMPPRPIRQTGPRRESERARLGSSWWSCCSPPPRSSGSRPG